MSAQTPLRLTSNEVDRAANEWGFNCGPGALCAVLNKTPNELRPHLLDFEKKGYTNPKLMTGVLDGLAVKYRQTYRSDEPVGWPILKHGLMRIQWGGPWCKPGVPMRARYRQTHWIAARNGSREIFDVNAIDVGGWISLSVWSGQLIPWLIKSCVPRGDGNFWATHALEVEL